MAPLTAAEAERTLSDLARTFLSSPVQTSDDARPNSEAKYRTLIEQLPAVVFMAYLDRGISEAYVSPRIEELLGFSQAEGLGDPVRWYDRMHPDDQQRWSTEAAEMFITGRSLRSAYRVIARDGRVIWFQCEATMVRREDGRPWFIHGVGFDITERKRMEQAVLEVGASVQRRIAQDLHDGLGQHLTGIAFMSKVLAQQLSEAGGTEAAAAEKIVSLVNEAISKTRELARGLLPVLSESDGLLSALKRWAAEVDGLFHIPCEIVCPEPVDVSDVGVATHLYHIAQEAVNNAIRHAKPSWMSVSLIRSKSGGVLMIEDNGTGFPEGAPRHDGLGLRIMRYRADIVGGSLAIQPRESGGTVVCCRFPLP